MKGKKAISILTSSALVFGSFGATTLIQAAAPLSAIAESSTETLSVYPAEVQSLFESYEAGCISLDTVKAQLGAYVGLGIIEATDLDYLCTCAEGMTVAVQETESSEEAIEEQTDESESVEGTDEEAVDGELDSVPDDSAESDEADGEAAEGEDATEEGDEAADGDEPSEEATEDDLENPDEAASEEQIEEAAADEGDEAATDATSSSAIIFPDSGSYTSIHYTQDLTTEEFIAVIGEQAREIAGDNDLYASVMIAQAILESGSGTSALSQAPNYNLFGIKGSYNDQSVTYLTQEDDGTGNLYLVTASFRKYDSYAESMEDYVDLLTHKLEVIYKGAWKSHTDTYADACDFLQGRYATDTNYSAKLQALIETYDLTRYDEPLDYEPVVPIMVQATDEETGDLLYNEDGTPQMEERTFADLLAELTSHLGTPYVWGGTTTDGFDCSGLVQYVYEQAFGITLPRTTYGQWLVGETASFDDLHPGDLLFWERDGDVYHVAMYIGDGYYIEAPHTGSVVKVTSMDEKMPSFAKRVIATKPKENADSQDTISHVYKEVSGIRGRHAKKYIGLE